MFKKLLLALASLIASTTIAFAAVDINKADKATLDTLKGVGPVIADRIIAERKKGEFKDWNDLISRVQGIGEATAAEMSGSGATIGGVSYKGGAPKAADKAKDKPAADKGKSDKPAATAAKSDKPAKEEAKKEAPAKADKAAADKKEKTAEKADKADKADKGKKDAPSKEAKKDAPSKDAKKEEKAKS